MSADAGLRDALCELGRSLYERGLTHGSTGNLSVRVSDGWLMTPTGSSLGRLDPARLSRLDNDDTGLNVFVISWIAHIVPRDPLSLFHAPIFFPDRYALAYSEHILVPSLMGAPLIWAGVPTVTVYNLLIVVGFTLSGWTMALVVRQWTGSTHAGVTAGMLCAFNAHLLTRLVHLQALHILGVLTLDEVPVFKGIEWRYTLTDGIDQSALVVPAKVVPEKSPHTPSPHEKSEGSEGEERDKGKGSGGVY